MRLHSWFLVRLHLIPQYTAIRTSRPIVPDSRPSATGVQLACNWRATGAQLACN
jgi:hypothetical protein